MVDCLALLAQYPDRAASVRRDVMPCFWLSGHQSERDASRQEKCNPSEAVHVRAQVCLLEQNIMHGTIDWDC